MTRAAHKKARVVVVGCGHPSCVLKMTRPAVRRQTLINPLVVASSAFCHPVRANQGETRCIVVKLSLGPKALQMAFRARLQRPVMNIVLGMTGATFLTGPVQDPIVYMTLRAFNLQMDAF